MKRVRDLRLLVTKSCNYKCKFCHGEGVPEQLASLLSPDDYAFLFSVMKNHLDFESVTLTGGEPLLRNDIENICHLLYKQNCKITLTTNGSLLSSKSTIGKYLHKVNISLHTIDKDKYNSIVQKQGAFDAFLSSIKQFRSDNPNTPIVFNITILKGVNDSPEDLLNIINFAKINNANIKFIELFPSTDSACLKLEELETLLQILDFKEIKSDYRITQLFDGETYITLTRIFCEIQRLSLSTNVCKEYNDLFISPNGLVKPCRNQKYTISIIDEIKSRDTFALTEKIQSSILALGEN